jgi:hypothetical protein
MIRMSAQRQALVTAAVLSVAAPLAGCGAGDQAAQSSSGLSNSVPVRSSHADSGVRGQVVYGPTCPVQRWGDECVRPYRATISIRSQRTNRLTARVRSTVNGSFSHTLGPGRYLLVPQTGHPYPRSSPREITVRSHRYTHVVITYDSGIR